MEMENDSEMRAHAPELAKSKQNRKRKRERVETLNSDNGFVCKQWHSELWFAYALKAQLALSSRAELSLGRYCLLSFVPRIRICLSRRE